MLTLRCIEIGDVSYKNDIAQLPADEPGSPETSKDELLFLLNIDQSQAAHLRHAFA